MIEPIWCRINLLGLYAFECARVVCVDAQMSTSAVYKVKWWVASVPAVSVCVVFRQTPCQQQHELLTQETQLSTNTYFHPSNIRHETAPIYTELLHGYSIVHLFIMCNCSFSLLPVGTRGIVAVLHWSGRSLMAVCLLLVSLVLKLWDWMDCNPSVVTLSTLFSSIMKVLMGLRGYMIMFTSWVIIIGRRFNIAILHISVACSFWQEVPIP